MSPTATSSPAATRPVDRSPSARLAALAVAERAAAAVGLSGPEVRDAFDAALALAAACVVFVLFLAAAIHGVPA
jgi:hypothetical protein